MVSSAPLIFLLVLWGDHPSQPFASRQDHITGSWLVGRGQKWEGLPRPGHTTDLCVVPFEQLDRGWGTHFRSLGLRGKSLEDRHCLERPGQGHLVWALSEWKIFTALQRWSLGSHVTDRLPWAIHTIQQSGAASPPTGTGYTPSLMLQQT